MSGASSGSMLHPESGPGSRPYSKLPQQSGSPQEAQRDLVNESHSAAARSKKGTPPMSTAGLGAQEDAVLLQPLYARDYQSFPPVVTPLANPDQQAPAGMGQHRAKTESPSFAAPLPAANGSTSISSSAKSFPSASNLGQGVSLSFFPSFTAELGQQLNMGTPTSPRFTYPSSEYIMQTDGRLNTLDEPVAETIKRDLVNIWHKLQMVLHPSADRENLLKDWDLWGPLLLCLTLAITLSLSVNASEGSSIFTLVFLLVTLGSVIVTINSKLLGGTISMFQSVCVLGYCLFPLVVSAILCLITEHLLFRLLIVLPSLAWSVYASLGFLTGTGSESRKMLTLYPMFLFYFFMAWLVVLS